MTEREVTMGEQEPRRRDVLELAKGVEVYFKQARLDAGQLALQRFDTEEEALAAAVQLAEHLEEVEALDTMPVRIVGPDVKVSNIQLEQDDEGVTTINAENPYVEVGLFGAEPTGTMQVLVPTTDQDDTGHIAVLYAMFENDKPMVAHLRADTLPLANIHVTHYVLAPLSTTEFIVPLLEQYDLRSKALSQVALSSTEGQPNSIKDALENLKAAVDDASEQHDFILFNQIEQLHELAKVSDDHVDVVAVVNAMRDIFGTGRPIELKGEAYIGLDPDVKKIEGMGKFIDILPPRGVFDVNEPVIVLEASSQLIYVPLSRIETLSF